MEGSCTTSPIVLSGFATQQFHGYCPARGARDGLENARGAIAVARGPGLDARLLHNYAFVGPDYSSRKAVTTGSLAARHAGNSPPKSPITIANVSACARSVGVTANANDTWLNDWKFIVDVW